MSTVALRAALETALIALGWADQTAWENKGFTPTADVAYQRVTLRLAEPDDSEIGAPSVDRGFMQVDLMFPPGGGPGDAGVRADAIRSAFFNGRTLTASGQTVRVWGTPEIMGGYSDDGTDRYVVPVRIRFRS